MSDFICTSSNAEKIVAATSTASRSSSRRTSTSARWVGSRRAAPTRPLAGHLHRPRAVQREAPGELRVRHPDAEVIAHPECDEPVLAQADFIGSTTGDPQARRRVAGADAHRRHRGRHLPPDPAQARAPASEDAPPGAAARTRAAPATSARYMRLNTLEKLYLCLRDLEPEVTCPSRSACARSADRADAGAQPLGRGVRGRCCARLRSMAGRRSIACLARPARRCRRRSASRCHTP